MPERLYFYCDKLDEEYSNTERELTQCSKDVANLVSSACNDGLHMPVIDIDLPCRWVPSTVRLEGHKKAKFVDGKKVEEPEYSRINCIDFDLEGY